MKLLTIIALGVTFIIMVDLLLNVVPLYIYDVL